MVPEQDVKPDFKKEDRQCATTPPQPRMPQSSTASSAHAVSGSSSGSASSGSNMQLVISGPSSSTSLRFKRTLSSSQQCIDIGDSPAKASRQEAHVERNMDNEDDPIDEEYILGNELELMLDEAPTFNLDQAERQIQVRSGTQYIDGVWRILRKGNLGLRGGADIIERGLRFSQWKYWHQGQDLFRALCNTMSKL